MKSRFKIIKISILFFLVVLSLSKIIKNELYVIENIYFKIGKSISIIMGAFTITLIIYGIYLQKAFNNKYNNSKKIYLGNNYWKQITIILVYIFTILYYLGIPFQIWSLISIIPITSILLFGFKSNNIILDYNNDLYIVTKDYMIYIIKNISYDNTYDILILEYINEHNKIEKISVNKIRNKKIFKDLCVFFKKYNTL